MRATARVYRMAWMARFLERHQLPLSIAVSVLLLWLFQQYGHPVKGFPNDSGEYWNLASLDTLRTLPFHRGYLFPSLLMPIRSLVDANGASLPLYRLATSAIYGVVLPWLLPALFRQFFGGRVTFWRRLLPVVLLTQIFPGMLLYPLTDLPALLLGLGALFLALKSVEPGYSNLGRFLHVVAAGVLAGGAYNMRTIYLFPMLGIGAFLAYGWWRASPRRYAALAAALAGFAAGLLLVSIPQGVVNKLTHGKNRLGVISQVDAKDLFASQLVWGITVQRYETTIDARAPAASVFYLDPAGERLFLKVAGQLDLFSLRGYARAVLSNPLEFMGVYTRHVVNGLDVRDGLAFNEKPSPLRTRTAFFNFCVLALAMVVLVSLKTTAAPAGIGAPSMHWPLAVFLILLPVAAVIPGAIETRFFLPLHLMAYGVVAFHFDLQRVRDCSRRHGWVLAAAILLAASVFFTISFSTMANQAYAWPAAYRYGMLPK